MIYLTSQLILYKILCYILEGLKLLKFHKIIAIILWNFNNNLPNKKKLDLLTHIYLILL